MNQAIQANGLQVSDTNPFPVKLAAPTAGRSFSAPAVQTITAGGTSQVVFAANTARVYLLIVNTSDTIMYVEFGAVAVATSVPLAANGGFYEPLVAPGQSVNLLCATTGKAFVAKEA